MFQKIFTSGTPDPKAKNATVDNTAGEPAEAATSSNNDTENNADSTTSTDTVIADQSPEVADKLTKMAQATEIYRKMNRKKGTTRKEIIASFIDDIGLSKAGAATYYQLIKKARR